MEDLRKKITILEFEFKHLAEMLIDGNQERWLPGYTSTSTSTAHINRYKWVSSYVRGKSVLDLACGSGFGSFYLADTGGAKKLVSGDYDRKAIEYCKAKHKKLRNLIFTRMDAENFSLSEKMDVVVCFETIEHLENPRLLLENCLECLNDNGNFFVSTPVSRLPIDTKPINPYHIVEWNIVEFSKLVRSLFSVEDVFIQPSINTARPQEPFYRRLLLRIYRHLYRRDLDFTDLDIFSIKSDLNKWQKLIDLNFIDAYIILRCQKKDLNG